MIIGILSAKMMIMTDAALAQILDNSPYERALRMVRRAQIILSTWPYSHTVRLAQVMRPEWPYNRKVCK